MNELLQEAGALLLAKGLLGVICLALAWTSWRFFSLYSEVQEKRIAEGREAIRAINESTAAIETLAEIIKAGGRGGSAR